MRNRVKGRGMGEGGIGEKGDMNRGIGRGEGGLGERGGRNRGEGE